MKNMKPLLVAALFAALVSPVTAQTLSLTNQSPANPGNILTYVEGVLTSGVNTNSTLWQSNKFEIYEGAVFSSVAGTAGQQNIGNDLGLTVPLLSLGAQTKSTGINVALDSQTRFEALFGNVADQQIGVLGQYNYYNLKLFGGVEGRYRFADNHLLAVPEFGVDYQIAGPLTARVEYLIPIQKKTGIGEGFVGVGFPF